MTTKMKMTQLTLSVRTSSKEFAKKAKNVFTPMISPSTETKKSIFTSIKEPNLSWTPLEASNSVPSLKMIWERSWAKKNKKWWKEPDLKSCVSSFWRPPKKISTDGNGTAPMEKLASTSIVFRQDTFWERTKMERGKSRRIKFRLKR